MKIPKMKKAFHSIAVKNSKYCL